MRRLFTSAMFSLFIALHLASPSLAQADWPQWRGPNRDGKAAEQSLLQTWPEGGPSLKWTFHETGLGYSAFSVVGDRLFTMGTSSGKSFVVCIDTNNGSEIWRSDVSRAADEEEYLHGWGGGCRSTPTIDGDLLYALSDIGKLACLKVSDGSEVWSVDLVSEFGGAIPKWGYSDSPLIDGDRVVVTPGGDKFLVALDKNSGKEVWSSKGASAPAQYVSIMKHTIAGTTFYVSASKPGLFGFDTTTGQQVFSDKATGNGVAVIPTTIPVGDTIYHTSAYGAGNTLIRLKPASGSLQVDPVYSLSKEAKSMENHHGGVILHEGTIFGFTKTNRGNWMAQDFKTGETLWMKAIGKTRSGSISMADGRLYCYNDQDGSLYLVEPSRQKFIERGKLTLPETTSHPRGRGAIWAHPVIAGGKLFLRDQELLFAYDIGR